MTKPKLVFNPVAQEYFDNPYEIYERMRDEAPIYYDEQEDFYALTRHADVAAAFKDHDSFSSARGCDLVHGALRGGRRRSRSSSWTRRTIVTCAACSTRRSHRGRSSRRRKPSSNSIEHYLGKADPDNFDVVQDFSGPFPVEVITRMAGVPEDFRQQVRHWIDKGLQRKPGQIDSDDDNMQANIDSGDVLLRSRPRAKEEPAGRHDQQAHRRRDPRRRREPPPARRHRDHRLHHASRRRGRGDRHQAGRQRRGGSSPSIPTSGGSCSTTAARSPPRSRNCCATSDRFSTTSATASRTSRCPAAPSPRTSPYS